MNPSRTAHAFFAAALALAIACIVAAPSVASRSEPTPAAVEHRFVPATFEIADRDEEPAPTF